MKTAKELMKENSEYPDAMKMAQIVGKKIIVIGCDKGMGEYGAFKIMKIKIGRKESEVITQSAAIVKVLELKKFPFSAKVVKLKSKKRKDHAEYYAFE